MDWFDEKDGNAKDSRGSRDDGSGSDLAAAIEAAPSHVSLPRDYLSASQLNLFLKCGRRYYFKYIQEKGERETSGMVHGRYVHSVVEWALREKMAGNPTPSREAVMDYVSSTIIDAFANVEKWEEKIPDLAYAESSVRAVLDVYTKTRLPEVRPRAVELGVSALLRGKYPFVGYIDLVEINPMEEDGYKHPSYDDDEPRLGDTIVDLKNTAKKYPESRIENSLQLALYSAVTGVPDVGFDLLIHRPPTQRKDEEIFLHKMRTMKTVEEQEHALDLVEDIAGMISAGVFPRTDPDTWACTERWCPFFSQCRGRDRLSDTAVIA